MSEAGGANPETGQQGTGTGTATVELDGPALFLKDDARSLLKGKRVYLIGDSNMRAIYKDLIVLVRDGKVSHPAHFKVKMETQFKGDEMVQHKALTKGRDYIEVREFKQNDLNITFGFVTKCWPNNYLQELLRKVRDGLVPPPDLVIMCSMLWDISRYGPHGVADFKRSLANMVQEVKRTLAPGTFLWVTQPPVGTQVTAAFLVEQLGFMSHLMRFHVMEANAFSCDVMEKENVDVFDLHYYMCYVTDLRDVDATHWRPEGIRLILCLLLTHVCLMWGVQPPRFRRKEFDIMNEINYVQLVKSLMYLRQERGWPEWLQKMVDKDPSLMQHLESFVSS